MIFLKDYLKARDIDLYAIELFGKGSPYDFESFNKTESWWDCLFPDQAFSDLTKYEIKDKVFTKLDEIKPDIVIGGSIVFFSGALGLRWAKKNKKKFIMFDDAKPSWVRRNVIVQTIKNLITNQIDGLWLPSDEYDAEYTKLYNKQKIRYLYGYDCVDNNLFKFDSDKQVNHKKIITVSRLVQKKNVSALLEAWQYVEEHDNEYSLVIVGNGPLYDELCEYKKSLGLKRVEFLGVMANEDIPKFLFEADAFVSPSLYESWGLVVNEAMAAGLPVILSDKINAAFSLLKHRENGYLFHLSEPDALRQYLLDFIRLTDEEKKSMSVKSLDIISKMDFDNMGTELINAIKDITNTPYKKPPLLPALIINSWYGRYNTIEWDKV